MQRRTVLKLAAAGIVSGLQGVPAIVSRAYAAPGAADAKFLLVSFNDEGFIAPDAMRAMLGRLGTVDVIETQYNAFRGSRNFDNRPIHVTEQLFVVEKR